jgi:predicted O-methyltransferase YrrM
LGPRGDERLLVVEPAAVDRARPGSSALRSAKINPSANVCPAQYLNEHPERSQMPVFIDRLRRIAGGLRDRATRHNMALVASALLGVAIAASAATGWQSLATALIGLTTSLALLAFMRLRRRLSVQIKDLAKRFDMAQHRILAAVENERLIAADGQSALEAGQRRLGRDMAKIQREQTAETEALLQLFREFEPRAPMPSSGRWAMDPTRLLEVLFLIGRKLPKVVLELGSGTSSIWIAYALEKDGGRLISVDHKTEFADRTKSLLHLHDVSHLAEVRLAELRHLNIKGEEFPWYNVDAFRDINEIDLLLVDGPPGSLGEMARYPALHVLESQLASNAVVILDDADRPDEQGIVRRWITEVAGLRKEREIFSGLTVLTYCRP